MLNRDTGEGVCMQRQRGRVNDERTEGAVDELIARTGRFPSPIICTCSDISLRALAISFGL